MNYLDDTAVRYIFNWLEHRVDADSFNANLSNFATNEDTSEITLGLYGQDVNGMDIDDTEVVIRVYERPANWKRSHEELEKMSGEDLLGFYAAHVRASHYDPMGNMKKEVEGYSLEDVYNEVMRRVGV